MRLATAAFCAAACAALCAAPAPAQDATFRAGVSLVRVDAEAVDPSGHLVPGLAKDDFRVLDQGRPVTLTGFSFDEEPLDLILLFDMAGSMKGKLHELVRAVELGFHELRSGDRVAVMIYNTRAQQVQSFTANMEDVNDAILLRVLARKFAGSSQLERPAEDAADRFRTEPATHRKRAVLAITDKPGGIAASPGVLAAVRQLWDRNAVLSELVVAGGGLTRLEAGPNALVDATGGVIIVAGVPGEAFQQSVHYLRSGYTLYYSPPDAGTPGEHKIQLSLTDDAAKKWPGLRLHARSGYFGQ